MSPRSPSAVTPPRRYRRLWRRFLWHRRKLAALCAAVAVFAALNVLQPPPPATVALVTVRHDIAAGARLRPGDLIDVSYPQALAPAHAVERTSDAVGRLAASGLARGTPLTSLNLSADAWSSLEHGHRAVPVRLQDSSVVDLLSPGQHVRLAAVDPRAPTDAETLVDDAVVLAIPQTARNPTSTTTGRLVVFDVPASRSSLVTSSAVSRYLTVIWGY